MRKHFRCGVMFLHRDPPEIFSHRVREYFDPPSGGIMHLTYPIEESHTDGDRPSLPANASGDFSSEAHDSERIQRNLEKLLLRQPAQLGNLFDWAALAEEISGFFH